MRLHRLVFFSVPPDTFHTVRNKAGYRTVWDEERFAGPERDTAMSEACVRVHACPLITFSNTATVAYRTHTDYMYK